MKKLSINNLLLYELVKNEVADGSSIRIKAQGNSMRPFVRGDCDELILNKPNEETFNKGSIVLARLKEGRLVAHRIAKTKGHTLVLRGDGNLSAMEVVQPKDIVAEVIAVSRHKKTIRKGSLGWNKYRYLWPSRPLLRKILLNLYR